MDEGGRDPYLEDAVKDIAPAHDSSDTQRQLLSQGAGCSCVVDPRRGDGEGLGRAAATSMRTRTLRRRRTATAPAKEPRVSPSWSGVSPVMLFANRALPTWSIARCNAGARACGLVQRHRRVLRPISHGSSNEGVGGDDSADGRRGRCTNRLEHLPHLSARSALPL